VQISFSNNVWSKIPTGKKQPPAQILPLVVWMSILVGDEAAVDFAGGHKAAGVRDSDAVVSAALPGRA
jgi:hypothetical protein